jgi:hypothetical protein
MLTPADVAIISMVFDLGYKVFTEKTKNMTPAELDMFVHNKEQSTRATEAEIVALYGNP